MKIGFDNRKYQAEQTRSIMERMRSTTANCIWNAEENSCTTIMRHVCCRDLTRT